jgi:hypothetical protein
VANAATARKAECCSTTPNRQQIFNGAHSRLQHHRMFMGPLQWYHNVHCKGIKSQASTDQGQAKVTWQGTPPPRFSMISAFRLLRFCLATARMLKRRGDMHWACGTGLANKAGGISAAWSSEPPAGDVTSFAACESLLKLPSCATHAYVSQGVHLLGPSPREVLWTQALKKSPGDKP